MEAAVQGILGVESKAIVKSSVSKLWQMGSVDMPSFRIGMTNGDAGWALPHERESFQSAGFISGEALPACRALRATSFTLGGQDDRSSRRKSVCDACVSSRIGVNSRSAESAHHVHWQPRCLSGLSGLDRHPGKHRCVYPTAPFSLWMCQPREPTAWLAIFTSQSSPSHPPQSPAHNPHTVFLQPGPSFHRLTHRAPV